VANFGCTLPPGAGSGGVARPESATGVEEPAATTTSFAEPQDVPPGRLYLAPTSSSRPTRPVFANRIGVIEPVQLDLLLTTLAAARSNKNTPTAPHLNSLNPAQDDDPLAVDAAFASLAEPL
jgi:hypothetical protein